MPAGLLKRSEHSSDGLHPPACFGVLQNMARRRRGFQARVSVEFLISDLAASPPHPSPLPRPKQAIDDTHTVLHNFASLDGQLSTIKSHTVHRIESTMDDVEPKARTADKWCGGVGTTGGRWRGDAGKVRGRPGAS